ncbi:MAG: hypothetical protein FWF56_05435 [Firmicutes bacterium]|nr:hypothetical protein [Bacillota bacterium]MCL1953863.1 hypothetical protein [Bacillota bacterium]
MKCHNLLCDNKLLSNIGNSHALLLVGEDSLAVEGLMKSYVAKVLCIENADALDNINKVGLNSTPCLKCKNCKLVLDDKHPDVIQLNKPKLVVADIQTILDSILISPFGEYKLYLISNFDTANEQAQNKLLKSLEEPPRNVIFVLGASTVVSILPTIMSRCRVYHVLPFELNALKQSMLAYYPDDDNLDLALSLSGGQITRVENFLNNPQYKSNFDIAISVLLNLKSSADLLSVSSTLISHKEHLIDIVDFIILILRDVLVFKNSLQDLVFSKAFLKDILDISKLYTSHALINILKQLNNILKRIKTFGNTNSIVDNLLFILLENKYNNRAVL